jgi:signal peptidase I
MRPKTLPFPARARRCVELAVVLLSAVVVLRTWFLDGFPLGCQISGGSMAETLLGRHRDVVCADCGHRFPCDAEGPQPLAGAVCPHCGYFGAALDEAGVVAGDRVLVDRATFLLRPPRRWEVVALRRPGDAHGLYVKRVVGLPGEAIEIRHGHVLADGKIQRRTLAQQRAMAILVYDASRRPTLAPPPPARWRPQRPHTAWDTAGGCFLHAATPPGQPVDWLVYRHARRVPGRPGEVTPTPVTDFCGYDQGRPRREEDVHAVAGLMLSLRVGKISGPGALVFWATDGEKKFRLELDPAVRSWNLRENGRPVAGSARSPRPGLPEALTVEISLFDQQFLLALDGETVIAWPYERPDQPAAPPAEPLAIGADRLAVALEEVRVYREVYYTEPVWARRGTPGSPVVRLGPGEYFVLGDNSPISEDSRTWPPPAAVSVKWLIGKPLAIIFPVRSARWGSWHFQVPDWGRMRYIR